MKNNIYRFKKIIGPLFLLISIFFTICIIRDIKNGTTTGTIMGHKQKIEYAKYPEQFNENMTMAIIMASIMFILGSITTIKTYKK